jgi:hypothetical protein
MGRRLPLGHASVCHRKHAWRYDSGSRSGPCIGRARSKVFKPLLAVIIAPMRIGVVCFGRAAIAGWSLASVGVVHAQSVEVAVSAELLRPIFLNSFVPLDFGRLTIGQSDGALSVGVTGQVSTTGGVVYLNNATAGQINISGSPGSTVSLNTPASFALAGPGPSLTVDSLELSNVSGPNRVSLDANGEAIVKLGGRLSVTSATVPGTYSGFVPVTATYQ